ncbi:general stress protein [Paenibacillus solisilvae]|uniref:General stress protein n=1 Tax=Paenibacillus solisilvae TaxID=2486751 RepID=A0ABW0VU73_9BACL
MAMKIGIFQSEGQAIEAVQALEQEGFTKTEIKVLAKDREHSRRVEEETNVHAEEVNELVDAREAAGDESALGLGIVPPAGLAGGIYAGGMMNNYGTPYGNGLALFATDVLSDHDGIERALSSLGLEDDSASACRSAIVDGDLVVAADVGNSQSDGGPDLTRSGAAEAALRRSGAQRIL